MMLDSGMRDESGVSDALSFSLSSLSLGEKQSTPYTEVSLACEGLLDKDWTSVSDPFAILYEMRSNGVFLERDRSEVVQNELNPKFCHKFNFEEQDHNKSFRLTFMDYDYLKGDDFLGNVHFTLKELLSPGKNKVTYGLENKRGKVSRRHGKLHMYPERLVRNAQQYRVGIELGIGADCKKDSKRKLFVCLSRSTGNADDYVRIFRSEAIYAPKSTEAFVFPTFDVDSATLTAQDAKRNILLEIFIEGGRNGNHKSVGEVVFKVAKLDNLKAGESVPFFSGISADGRCRPQLVFPCMNWNVGRSASVIAMRVSNLWIRW